MEVLSCQMEVVLVVDYIWKHYYRLLKVANMRREHDVVVVVDVVLDNEELVPEREWALTECIQVCKLVVLQAVDTLESAGDDDDGGDSMVVAVHTKMVAANGTKESEDYKRDSLDRRLNGLDDTLVMDNYGKTDSLDIDGGKTGSDNDIHVVGCKHVVLDCISLGVERRVAEEYVVENILLVALVAVDAL